MRVHYEERAASAFGGPDHRFVPENTILASDVGLALIEKHFDRPPIGLSEVFELVERLIADIRPQENVERAAASIPTLFNVLGTMIGNGLLRPGYSAEWFEDPITGHIRLRLGKINAKVDPIEVDPIGVVRNAFLQGQENQIRHFLEDALLALGSKPERS